MKVLDILKNGIALMEKARDNDPLGITYLEDEIKAYKEALNELESLKSCDGCIHKDLNTRVMDYDCFECSRYYADKFEKRINNECNSRNSVQ